MKHLFIFSLMIVFILTAKNKYEYASVNISGLEDIKFLQENKIDIDRTSFTGKGLPESVQVYVTNEEFQFIEKEGYVVKWTPLVLPSKLTDYRYNEEIEDSMDVWELRYPDICKKIIIGYSVQNRPLCVLKISDNVDIEEAEPEFKYTSTMHGDEVTGVEMNMYLIENILKGYETNVDTMQFIVNNTELYIMPLHNPDGMALGQRYNANNVDLNRNFPEWTHGDSNVAGSYTPYSGTTTAIENIAIMNWSNDHNFVLSANFHGGALVANYLLDAKVGFSSGQYAACPDDEHVTWMAYNYSVRNTPMFNGSFTDGITNGCEWYTIDCGMQDWNYNYHNDLEVTLELSVAKWPAFSEMAGFWEDNRESMFWYLSAVHKGIYGAVIDYDTGLPLDATIEIIGIDKEYYTDPDFGDYYRILIPGTYSMTVSAPGYISQTINNIVVTDDTGVFKEATEVNVQLIQDGTQGGLFSLQQSSLSYGDVTIERSSVKQFTIENTHLSEAMIGEITTIVDFIVTDAVKSKQKNVLGYTIPPSSTQTFDLEFNPQSEGVYSGDITITSSDPNNLSNTLPVSGNSIIPDINLSVLDTLVVNTIPGGSAQKSFNIENIDTGILDYSMSVNYKDAKDISKASGGPDTFGYTWKDGYEGDGPTYIWVDITGTGTPLGLDDDGESGAIDLGFTFNYYGVDYTSIVVGANGAVTFTGTDIAFQNPMIPDPATSNAVIAPFWDDLDPSSGQSDDIYYYYDSANNRFIIQYNEIINFNGSNKNTFEIILNENGKILFQYQLMNGTLNSCTIGIENEDGTDGLQVVSNNTYLENDLAIEFNPNTTPEWLSLDIVSGSVVPSNFITITAFCDATELLSFASYHADINIFSNDPDEPIKVLPVKLVLSDILATPQNVIPDGTTNLVLLYWDVVSGANLYRIYRSITPYSGFTEIGTSSTPDYTDNDILSGNKYFYQITADNAK